MYKEDIIDTLLTEIIKHIDVNTVAWGSEFDININGKTVYPYVFIESEASNLVFENTNNQHSMALYFLDQHKEDSETDIKDKQRITEQIMYEVAYYIENNVDDIYILDGSLNAISLKEFNSDVTAGWRMDVTFIVNPPLDRCTYKSKFV